MYTRWNDTNKWFEKDTSADQDGSGPWVELSVDGSQIGQGTIPSGQIPNLDASKITTGIFADTRLSSNVPLKNTINLFTTDQELSVGKKLFFDGGINDYIWDTTDGDFRLVIGGNGVFQALTNALNMGVILNANSGLVLPNNNPLQSKNNIGTGTENLIGLNTSNETTIYCSSSALVLSKPITLGSAGTLAGYIEIVIDTGSSATTYKIPYYNV